MINARFENSNDLFDFAVSNTQYKNYFIHEIQSIIFKMTKMLYEPPFAILLGRINIYKEIQVPKSNLNKKNINQQFYDGFEFQF